VAQSLRQNPGAIDHRFSTCFFCFFFRHKRFLHAFFFFVFSPTSLSTFDTEMLRVVQEEVSSAAAAIGADIQRAPDIAEAILGRVEANYFENKSEHLEK
jgi:hypothetical protein